MIILFDDAVWWCCMTMLYDDVVWWCCELTVYHDVVMTLLFNDRLRWYYMTKLCEVCETSCDDLLKLHDTRFHSCCQSNPPCLMIRVVSHFNIVIPTLVCLKMEIIKALIINTWQKLMYFRLLISFHLIKIVNCKSKLYFFLLKNFKTL